MIGSSLSNSLLIKMVHVWYYVKSHQEIVWKESVTISIQVQSHHKHIMHTLLFKIQLTKQVLAQWMAAGRHNCDRQWHEPSSSSPHCMYSHTGQDILNDTQHIVHCSADTWSTVSSVKCNHRLQFTVYSANNWFTLQTPYFTHKPC